jgi:MerR family mercuric resistance operon transcriptional regulator
MSEPANHDIEDAPRRMKISQAARAAGVSKQTIEYYVMLGLIEPLREGPANRRFFTDEHVKRIRLIRQLNQTGYTLRAIKETYLR